MYFSNAIVRVPSSTFSNGITSSGLGKPNVELAIEQHKNYCKVLEQCGLKIEVLTSIEKFPDSCFVEDTAVLTKEMAVIALLGDHRRKGESAEILPTIQKYKKVFPIIFPGTLDGGDVMQIEDTFYIGLSNRTNILGAEQFGNIVQKFGYKAITVDVGPVLHLKTGVNYIGENTILVQDYFKNNPLFKDFDKILINKEEEYAANSLRVNDTVIVPEGFDKTASQIVNKGFNVATVNVSEFQKMDGGLSCLSLRFQ